MKKNKSNLKWYIGGSIVLGTIVIISTLNLNVVYFYTASEASAKYESIKTADIKVGGLVKPGSINWTPETLQLKFIVLDNYGTELNVIHKGTAPDMFKEGQGVVVEGRLSSPNSLVSKKLLVKHSEEYKVPGEGQSIDHELLKKSMFK